jgi:3-dehydroquinate synthase
MGEGAKGMLRAMSAPRSSAVKRVLVVLGCAVLVPIVPFALIGELPGQRWLDAQGDHALSIGAAGAGLLAIDVILPIPSSILGALLGGRLGFLLGFLWSWLGLCAGSALGYALGRLWPAHFAAGMSEVTGDAPASAVILLSRSVPVLAEAVSLAAGVARVPVARFALASVTGNGLYAAAMAGNGAALLPEGLAGPGLVLPMIVPVAAFLYWRSRIARRVRMGPTRSP